jgi:hypothetical protein
MLLSLLVLIETLDLDSLEKELSLGSRDQKILILSWHNLPVSKVSIKIEKPVQTRHFWQILTVCLDLDQELVNFDFWAW